MEGRSDSSDAWTGSSSCWLSISRPASELILKKKKKKNWWQNIKLILESIPKLFPNSLFIYFFAHILPPRAPLYSKLDSDTGNHRLFQKAGEKESSSAFSLILIRACFNVNFCFSSFVFFLFWQKMFTFLTFTGDILSRFW